MAYSSQSVNSCETSLNHHVMVGLDEPAKELLEVDYHKLSEILCRGAEKCERTATQLANSLGMNNVLEEPGSSQEKILLLLLGWRRKNGSTVRVLITVMREDLNRTDCAEFIDNEARYKYTKIHIIVHSPHGETVPLDAGRVPERQTLIAHVRPLLQTYLAAHHSPVRPNLSSYKAQLKPLDKLHWDSPIKYYKGKQIDIHLSPENSQLENEQRGVSEPSMPSAQQVREQNSERRMGKVLENRRNANTEYHNLSFGYLRIPIDDPHETRRAASQARHRQTGTRDLREREESRQGEFPRVSEDLSLRSVCSCSSSAVTRVVGETVVPPIQESDDRACLQNLSISASMLGIDKKSLSRLNATDFRAGGTSGRPTTLPTPSGRDGGWDDISDYPGFHEYPDVPERDLAAMGKIDVDNHYSKFLQDGCYIIRRSPSRDYRFAISLRHRERKFDFNIVRNQDFTYRLNVMPSRGFQTVQALIQYYKDNDLDNLPGVRLTVPIP